MTKISPITVSFDARSLRLDTSEDAEVICGELEDKDVEVLILQGNTFGIEAAERVGLELAKQPKLREAHFKDLFTSRGREEVPEALKHLLNGISDSGAELTLLDLSDNAIGPIGAPSVIDFLSSPSCETLEKLYVNNCGWGPDGSTSLATTIPRLKHLKELICGRSRLENVGAKNMSRALLELNNLEVLKLNQNGIKVQGIIDFVEVLKANKDTIIEFDLSDNTIKTEGSRALADAIKIATKLRTISLSDALLENEGFKEICKAISLSPSLETLKTAAFEGNELNGNLIVDTIINTFSKCHEDFTLNLLENEFRKDEIKRLKALSDRFRILLDDEDSDDDDEDDDDNDDDDEDNDNTETNSNCSESGVSNGYVDIEGFESELREISQDFIKEVTVKPFNEESTNQAFFQLIKPGHANLEAGPAGFQAIQILCEELGLIKCEDTRKKKPLAREAINYLIERLEDLPKPFRDFFEAVIKNNDELCSGKLMIKSLMF